MDAITRNYIPHGKKMENKSKGGFQADLSYSTRHTEKDDWTSRHRLTKGRRPNSKRG